MAKTQATAMAKRQRRADVMKSEKDVKIDVAVTERKDEMAKGIEKTVGEILKTSGVKQASPV